MCFKSPAFDCSACVQLSSTDKMSFAACSPTFSTCSPGSVQAPGHWSGSSTASVFAGTGNVHGQHHQLLQVLRGQEPERGAGGDPVDPLREGNHGGLQRLPLLLSGACEDQELKTRREKSGSSWIKRDLRPEKWGHYFKWIKDLWAGLYKFNGQCHNFL